MDEVRDERLYQLDYAWLWDDPPHNSGPEARLRVRLSAKGDRELDLRERPEPGQSDLEPDVSALVHHWLDSLSDSEPPIWGEAGWATTIVSEQPGANAVVLDLWSAGEDVADGIHDATRSFYNGVLRDQPVSVVYEQLPRDAC